MSSPFYASCLAFLCTLLFQTASAGSQHAYIRAAEADPGYICDNTVITGILLRDAIKEFSETKNYNYEVPEYEERSEDPSNRYSGLPFMKEYSLWPIHPQAPNYIAAKRGPFRVVIDNNFQIISVIMKNGQQIKECRSKERVSQRQNRLDYMCAGSYLTRDVLEIAATSACLSIHNTISATSALRYSGPPFKGAPRQLYVSPVSRKPGLNGNNNLGSEAYVVFNIACKVVGAVRKTQIPPVGTGPSEASYALCDAAKRSGKFRPSFKFGH